MRDVPGVAQRSAGVEQGAADRRAAVGEHDQVHALLGTVGESQHRPTTLMPLMRSVVLFVVFGQAGDPPAGVHHLGRYPRHQGAVQQGPRGQPTWVGACHGVCGLSVPHGDLLDRFGGVLDELVLVDADAVEDVQRGMLQRDQAAVLRCGGRDSFVHTDAVEPGVQQQQSGGGTGQRPAHHGNGRLAAGG